MSDQSQNAPIIAAFDAAADSYDAASKVQRDIARKLVARAAQSLVAPPKTILDLGSGAGHVTGEALKLWPAAEIVALDAAPAMLAGLRAKYPGVKTLRRDASKLDGAEGYDLILSSMMLHWLTDPRTALTQWREKLNPGGKLHVAVPVEGSLSEWRDFLRAEGVADGLWTFPPPGLSRDVAASAETIAFAASYPDARAFLQSLKRTGAHTSRAGRRPSSPAVLRRLLAARQGEFTATFQILFLEIEGSQTERG